MGKSSFRSFRLNPKVPIVSKVPKKVRAIHCVFRDTKDCWDSSVLLHKTTKTLKLEEKPSRTFYQLIQLTQPTQPINQSTGSY